MEPSTSRNHLIRLTTFLSIIVMVSIYSSTIRIKQQEITIGEEGSGMKIKRQKNKIGSESSNVKIKHQKSKIGNESPNMKIKHQKSRISQEIRSTRWKPFNQTNPHATSWCPSAVCHNSPICTPCHRRYLFILATARSGSTTVLHTLNRLPGVRLSGENENVLYGFWKLIRGGRMPGVLNGTRDRAGGAWMHNAVPRGAVGCAVQRFMNTINPPPLSVQRRSNVVPLGKYDRSTVMGAKMIRIQMAQNDWSAKEAAEFIQENFPCAKIVINIRSDVQSQVISHTKAFIVNPSNMTSEDMLEENKYLLSVAEEMGDAARVIDMTEWSEDVSILNNLIEWIGFKGCALKRLAHCNQGENGFKRGKVKTKFASTCRYAY